MTLGSHQHSIGKSQNHISPFELVQAIGPFDLDPAAASSRPWDCARISWTSGSLEREWPRELFIYLNPPFDRREVGRWIAKLAQHGNGICLTHARCEAAWFEPIWQHAAAILFLADRIHFHRPDGSRQPANSGAPAVLAAFGDEAVLRLHRCGIGGALVVGWSLQPAGPILRRSARPSITQIHEAAP
jgi:DNA N-6-adenine-methyltransferase (Dam)